MKILITGHGQHGKDTLAEYLKLKYNISYITSSEFALKNFIYDTLKDKFNYKTIKDCFDDRRNRRNEWYILIQEYCNDDKAKMAKEVFKEYDCFVGQRDEEEFVASKNLYDIILWVDASKRKPLEKTMTIDYEKHKNDMIIIDNNYTKEYLYEQIDDLNLFKCKKDM